ncbi:MAG: nucleotide pyrophosphatase [Phormidesmis sp. RL_2_1]|nr:nucleotide pyrophosphatase [Phormidesmis sp. RL_2_1]
MKRSVIAIGLDAADPELLDDWMEKGYLNNLKKLRKQGAYGRLEGGNYYKAETPWTNFLTACEPEATGYWGGIKLIEGTYDVQNIQAYDFEEHPPFYALGSGHKVAVFDMPKGTLSPNVDGVQVLAWGAHSPGTPSHSQPKEVFLDIERKYGKHPALHKDHGDWWNREYLTGLQSALQKGIEARTQICLDFLQEEDWDLFLTVFGEPHSAGHDFWFLSQPDHPLYEYVKNRFPKSDPLLETFRAVDASIGKIVETASEDTTIVIFSVHGSGNNTTDVPSMFMLGEFLYRWNFPGEALIAKGDPTKEPPTPLLNPKRKTWTGEIWQLREDPNIIRRSLRRSLPSKAHKYIDRFLGSIMEPDLSSAQKLQAEKDPFFWQPVSWYKPFWPKMKAFALPSFSEGYIRINLKGREPHGIVDPSDYETVCDELTADLMKIINPRNGKPVVKQVIRSRNSSLDRDPKNPGADLIVEWADIPADVIDHPKCGRIGPVPYRRTGSHRARGFINIKGPGIAGGTVLPEGRSIDVGPTILNLMDAPVPNKLEGKSVLWTLSQAETLTSSKA